MLAPPASQHAPGAVVEREPERSPDLESGLVEGEMRTIIPLSTTTEFACQTRARLCLINRVEPK